MRKQFLLGLILLALAGHVSADWMWAKGNLHTHTTFSDGRDPAEAVAEWYKSHGYQFLVLSDHDKLTDSAPFDKPGDDFILIPGEEIGVVGSSLPIHANAFGIKETVKPPTKSVTPGRSIRNLVDLIVDSAGIPQVNHPNWMHSLDHRELLQIRQPFIVEIANMASDDNNNFGSASRLSNEQVWDVLLSDGRTVYAAATDDMHMLQGTEKDFLPGRGWVVARVPELTPSAILKALASGDFYASIGVEIADLACDGKVFRVKVKPQEDKTYLIRFIGKWGEILQGTEGISAAYKITGDESYVRCKVIASDGRVAWTQAFRLGK